MHYNSLLQDFYDTLRGDEYYSSRQVGSTVTHKVFTRFLQGIVFTTDDRLKFTDRSGHVRYFYINSYENVHEMNRELELHCTEDMDLHNN